MYKNYDKKCEGVHTGMTRALEYTTEREYHQQQQVGGILVWEPHILMLALQSLLRSIESQIDADVEISIDRCIAWMFTADVTGIYSNIDDSDFLQWKLAEWLSLFKSNVHVSLIVFPGILWQMAMRWSKPFNTRRFFHKPDGSALPVPEKKARKNCAQQHNVGILIKKKENLIQCEKKNFPKIA